MEEMKNTTESGSILSKENTMYCRHCNQPISIESDSCPHCGNADPFLFKKIEKEKKDTSFTWWHFIVVAFGVEIYYDKIEGISEGFFNWHIAQIKTFAIVCIVIYAFLQIGRYFKMDDFRKEMRKVFEKVNDKEADERWYNKAKVLLWEFLDND